MYMTKHAQERMQQRGINESAVQATLYFGDRFYAGDGSIAYFLSRRALDRARRLSQADLHEYRNTAVILSADRAVITVQYTERPKKSWRGKH